MKTCSRCNIHKPLSDFTKDARYSKGVTSWCKDCKYAYVKSRKLYVRHQPKPIVTSKRCLVCKVVKPGTDFVKALNQKSGLRARCKECVEKQRIEGKNTPERAIQHAANKFKRLYNLTIEEVACMIENQKGLCKICAAILSRPNVDHCHVTGRIRGILCSACNTGLGFIEKENWLEKAQGYLSQ